MDSFRAALDQYLEAEGRDRGLSQSTLKHYRNDLKLFAQWSTLQSLSMLDVQRADVLAFLAYLHGHGHSSADVNRILSRLHKFYGHQCSLGRLGVDPTKGIATLP